LARRRFFVETIRSGTAELGGAAARHLTRVLRVEPGQRYEISDSHFAWLAEIVEARGDRVVFHVLEPLVTPPPPVEIGLSAALFMFDRFEWMIEKATELGVEAFVVIATARTEKGLLEASRKRSERWERIAQEAGQQSRRLRAPGIQPAIGFEQALLQVAGQRYFLDEDLAPPFLRALDGERAAGARVALLTGPEGGWTDAERDAAIGAGWQPVSLGAQILRAETAALAAVAVLVNAWLGSARLTPQN